MNKVLSKFSLERIKIFTKEKCSINEIFLSFTFNLRGQFFFFFLKMLSIKECWKLKIPSFQQLPFWYYYIIVYSLQLMCTIFTVFFLQFFLNIIEIREINTSKYPAGESPNIWRGSTFNITLADNLQDYCSKMVINKKITLQNPDLLLHFEFKIMTQKNEAVITIR